MTLQTLPPASEAVGSATAPPIPTARCIRCQGTRFRPDDDPEYAFCLGCFATVRISHKTLEGIPDARVCATDGCSHYVLKHGGRFCSACYWAKAKDEANARRREARVGRASVSA